MTGRKNHIHDFWNLVDHGMLSRCWLWKGRTQRPSCAVPFGYGSFSFVHSGKRERLTHRIAYIFAFGGIPEGMDVLHRCDEPRCCNPACLFLGTQAENTADMIVKGRKRDIPVLGERHYKAKLTEENVREIRRRCASGESQSSLARFFGVPPSNVSMIVKRMAWKHVS